MKKELFVSSDEMIQTVRQSHNHVSVWHIKQMVVNSPGPFHGVSPTAIWAKSVFTAMKYFNGLPAIITGVNILTKGFSAALSDGIYSFVLHSCNRILRMQSVFVPMLIEKRG